MRVTNGLQFHKSTSDVIINNIVFDFNQKSKTCLGNHYFIRDFAFTKAKSCISKIIKFWSQSQSQISIYFILLLNKILYYNWSPDTGQVVRAVQAFILPIERKRRSFLNNFLWKSRSKQQYLAFCSGVLAAINLQTPVKLINF